MDKILLGVAASTHPEGVKRAIIGRVIGAAARAPTEDLVASVLDIASRWMTEEESVFLQQAGRELLHAWAKHNQTLFDEFFARKLLGGMLGRESPSPERTVHFVHEGLAMSRRRAEAARLVQAQAMGLVRRRGDLPTLAALSQLLLAFPECLPGAQDGRLLCAVAVECVGALRPAALGPAAKAALEGMVPVSALLHHVWRQDPSTVLPSLAAVFNLISTLPSDGGAGPSVALGALVQHVPAQLIAAVTRNAVSDVSIADGRMTAALTRMIEWLSWPRVQNIDRWIVAFLKNLALAQKFTILISVTIASVEKVFVKLCFPIVRDSALPVLTHMLLSFQHSPEAFHKIVGHVPELLKRLRSENSPSSRDCSQKVGELVYCLMYQHAGYPDLYETILETLKDIARPTEELMKEKLKLSAWTSQTPVNSALSTRFLPRSETGKTGLDNLGNTCYMNSVLQALVMTSGFPEEIMACPVYNHQCVIARLQMTFAFLAHTQRAAYSPKEFLVASRPPWFSPGTQQDCSEFLKYLLDRLDEEEKSVRRFEAQLQRTRERVERMKRKNAKREAEEAEVTAEVRGRTEKEAERQEGGRTALSRKTLTDGRRRSASDSALQTEPASALAESSSRRTTGNSKTDQDIGAVSKKLWQAGHSAVCPEPEIKSPEADAATISLAPCRLTDAGNPLHQPQSDEESARTHLMVVNLLEKDSGADRSSSPASTTGKKLPEETEQLSIVEEYFAGKSVTRIRCLSCNSVSSRAETFFDLPLAFPGSDAATSMRGGQSCANKEDAAGKGLGLEAAAAAERLAQEELARGGGKQWELNGGATATASTSTVKELASGPGQSGESSQPPRGSPSRLEELLEHYLTPELLTGDNRYHCEKCRCLRDAEKRIEIAKPPKVLMLTLMRFSYDVKTHSRCKILADVKFPKVLNLELSHPGRESPAAQKDPDQGDQPTSAEEQDSGQDPPCSKRVRQNSENTVEGKSNHRFALYGVIVHSGISSESGHYYCYARHSDFLTDPVSRPSKPQAEPEAGDNETQGTAPDEVEDDLLPDQWFLFNDSRVSFSSYDSFGNVTRRFPKDTAYVLFYRQVPECSVPSTEGQTRAKPSPAELRKKPVRKELQEAVKKDNAQYLKERELEARTLALRTSRGWEGSSSNHHNSDDRNDPPSGCGGGGGGMQPPRLVF